MLTSITEALYELADQCHKVAFELIACLQKVISHHPNPRKWESVWQALKTVWSKDQFDSLARKLADYREQLSLRILLVLNSHRVSQEGKIGLLQKSNEEIVEVVSINTRYVQHAMEDQSYAHANAERRHAETMAAIFTTRGGDTRTVTGPNYCDSGQPASKSDVTTYKQGSKGKFDRTSHPANFETRDFTSFTKWVLDALHFRTVNARRIAIPKAHQRTFQWAYEQRSTRCDAPWDSLSAWLREGSGCYWINGKAGSGKSTLMKFLQENSRTEEALKQWAGSSTLIVASFFFWYAGTELQKSQTGMLRALLLEVLTRRPALVPVLFPDVCRSILAKQLSGPIDLSFAELQKAFSHFVKSTPSDLKVCFIIDGIDEYDGDHNEISEILAEAAASKSVKVLLSSRPIPPCVQAFSHCQKLRLQDLTFRDVQHYVEDKISGHTLMRRLEIAQNGATRQLIDAVTSKASGVLLWVVLAVRSIINGLQDYDTMVGLLQKLENLPPDLERLYDHMLGSMIAQHRREGSKLLQLVLRSTETHGSYPMTLLQLSFAEDEEYSTSIISLDSAISLEQEEWKCEATEGRMRSRCCGLIEVQNPSSISNVNSGSSSVGFIHRTVVEYLQADTIWPQLVALTNGTKFNIYEALLSSSLAEMKAKPPPNKYDDSEHQAYNAMLRMLSYQRNTENGGDMFRRRYQAELKITMSRYWHEAALFDSPELQTQFVAAATARSTSRFDLCQEEAFLLYCASQCPKTHLKGLLQWEKIPVFQQKRDGTSRGKSLKACLLVQYMDEKHLPYHFLLSSKIVELNEDPNQEVSFRSGSLWSSRWKEALSNISTQKCWTLWEAILLYVHEVTEYEDYEVRRLVRNGCIASLLDVVMSMVNTGAKVSVVITIYVRKNYVTCKTIEMTACEVIFQLIEKAWELWDPDEAPPSSKPYQVHTTAKNSSFVKKVCELEEQLRSQQAKRWIRTYESTYSETPTPGTSSRVKKRFRLKSILQNQSDATKYKADSGSLSEPKISHEYIKGPSCIDMSSPWRKYKQSQDSLPKVHGLPSPSVLKSVQEPKHAKPDPEPASDSEELAEQLARFDLSPKEQRALSARMLKKPYHKQSQIMIDRDRLRRKQG